MLSQLPNGAAGFRADQDFPSANQLRPMIVKRLHRYILKMSIALFELATARDNQTVLVNQGKFSQSCSVGLYTMLYHGPA